MLWVKKPPTATKKAAAVVELFVEYFRIISFCAAFIITAAFWFRHRFRMNHFRILEMFAPGISWLGLPIGILLVLIVFKPELTDELRKFSDRTAFFGLFYIYFVIIHSMKKFKE